MNVTGGTLNSARGSCVRVAPSFPRFICDALKFRDIYMKSAAAGVFLVNPVVEEKVEALDVEGCTMIGASTGSNMQMKNVHNISVSGTRFEGGYLELVALDSLRLTNNHFKNMNARHGVLLDGPQNRNFFQSGNIFEDWSGDDRRHELMMFASFKGGKIVHGYGARPATRCLERRRHHLERGAVRWRPDGLGLCYGRRARYMGDLWKHRGIGGWQWR